MAPRLPPGSTSRCLRSFKSLLLAPVPFPCVPMGPPQRELGFWQAAPFTSNSTRYNLYSKSLPVFTCSSWYQLSLGLSTMSPCTPLNH